MACQQLGRRLAHLRNAERTDEALERDGAPRLDTAQQIFDNVPTYSSGGYYIGVWNSTTHLFEKVVAGTISADNFTRSDSNTDANAVTKTYADTKFAKADSNSFGAAITKTYAQTKLAKSDTNAFAGAVTLTALNAKVPVSITSGTGTPLGVVTAVVGSIFIRTNGVVDSTIYVKMTGSGNTGWYPLSH